jgi:hypothetical protein
MIIPPVRERFKGKISPGDESLEHAILQLTKMGPFWEHLCAAQCAAGWLVGLV